MCRLEAVPFGAAHNHAPTAGPKLPISMQDTVRLGADDTEAALRLYETGFFVAMQLKIRRLLNPIPKL